MREILFRGKRVDNGEWIEGNLVKLGKESFSDPERSGICHKAIPIAGLGMCYNLMIYEVIPSTVGQYTGLTDKNGKRIFEGDIVKTKEFGKDSKYGFNCADYDNFKIEYIGGSFVITSTIREFYLRGERLFEVIGNIHDNPEHIKHIR